MMKRMLAMILALCVCFGLCACGAGGNQGETQEPSEAPVLPADSGMQLVLSGVEADAIAYYPCEEAGNFAVIEKDGKCGIIGYDGTMLLPMECERIYRGSGERYQYLLALKENVSYAITSDAKLEKIEAVASEEKPEIFWYQDKAVFFVLGEGPEDFSLEKHQVMIDQRPWQANAVLPVRQLSEVIEEPWGLMPVVDQERYGLLDVDTGAMVTEFVYESFDATNGFCDGLLAMKKDGKWGYVDTKGNTVLDFVYDPCETDAFGSYERMNPVTNGYVTVCKDGKWGLVDKTGKVILETAYAGISQVNPEGMFWIKGDSSWSLYRLAA